MFCIQAARGGETQVSIPHRMSELDQAALRAKALRAVDEAIDRGLSQIGGDFEIRVVWSRSRPLRVDVLHRHIKIDVTEDKASPDRDRTRVQR